MTWIRTVVECRERSRDILEVETTKYANRLHLGGERKEIKGNLPNYGLSNQVGGILPTKTGIEGRNRFSGQ